MPSARPGEDDLQPRSGVSALAAGVLVAAFVALAALYSVVVPLGEPPDEIHHFRFVRYLVERRELPRQEFKPGNPVDEGHQPPLYYALAAVATAGTTADDLGTLAANPSFSGFRTDPLPNKALYIHTSQEDWPYRGYVLAWHLVRAVSIGLGALTVWLTYRLGRCLRPGHPAVGLAAAGLVAFNPQFLFISASANNDALAAAIGALVTLLLARIVAGRRQTRDFLGLGVALGLAALTKLFLLALFPVVAVVLFLMGLAGAGRGWWRKTALAAAATVGVAGWWYGRNLLLYGDPFALNVARASHPDHVGSGQLDWALLDHFWGTFSDSFWARFGHLNLVGPEPVYTWTWRLVWLGLLGALLFLGLSVWRRRGRAVALVSVLAVVALAAIAIVVAFAVRQGGSGYQGRYFFPGLAALAVLVTLGWNQWTGFRLGGLLAVGTAGGLAVLSLALLSTVVVPAYAQPRVELSWGPTPAAAPIGATFAGRLRLAGYSLESAGATRDHPPVLSLYWEVLAPSPLPHVVLVNLLDRQGRPVAGRFADAVWRGYPLGSLPAGQRFRQHLVVPLEEAGAGDYTVRVEVMAVEGKAERLSVDGAAGATGVLLPAPLRLASVAPRPLVLDTARPFR